MKYKYKLIEADLEYFEKELNAFTSQENITVVNIQYSSVGFPPDKESRWHWAIVHSALIEYFEI